MSSTRIRLVGWGFGQYVVLYVISNSNIESSIE